MTDQSKLEYDPPFWSNFSFGMGFGTAIRYFLGCWLLTGNCLAAILPAAVGATLVAVKDRPSIVSGIGSALLVVAALNFAGVFEVLHTVLLRLFSI